MIEETGVMLSESRKLHTPQNMETFVNPNIEVEDVILKKKTRLNDTLKHHVWYTRKVLSGFILNI